MGSSVEAMETIDTRGDCPQTSLCGHGNRGFCDLVDSSIYKARREGDFGQAAGT